MFCVRKVLMFLLKDEDDECEERQERERMAAGGEPRRAKKTVSYVEEESSDGACVDGDEYLTAQQIQNKTMISNRRKQNTATSGGPTRNRKTSAIKKDPSSKKRGRPSSKPNVEGSNESSRTVPKKRGRKPKTHSPVEVEVELVEGSVEAQEHGIELELESNSVNISGIDSLQMDELSLITPMRKMRRRRCSIPNTESALLGCVDDGKNDGSWETAIQQGRRCWEHRYKLEEGTSRPSQDRVRRHRNDEEESESDSGDDIPSPHNLPVCRLGNIEECPYCSAQHYPNGHVCCDKGTVFIHPMRKVPPELVSLLFGKGMSAKIFRPRVLSYNNAFAFASIQYNRVPAAPHGVQSMKIQGNPGHFPSCAIPYGNNDPVYGNVYLYSGQKAIDLRMNVYSQLNKEIVKLLENCMSKNNHWAVYYRNLGEIINEEEKNAPGSGSYVRMKIINANDVDPEQLQAHSGVYRKVLQGGDHVALFFQASVEQDVKIPGLLIYPKRGQNPILPLFAWDPKTTSLCYPIFCPYGEYLFHHQMYLLLKGENRKLKFKERLVRYAREVGEAAKDWEVELDVEELLGESLPANDEPEQDDVEMIVEDADGDLEELAEADEVFQYELMAPEDEERQVEQQEELVEVTANDAREEAEMDMSIREHERDFDAIIQPEEYPTAEIDWTEMHLPSSPVFSFPLLPSDEVPAQQKEISEVEDDDDNEQKPSKQSESREFASLKQFLTYIYQKRTLIPNRFLRGGKLGQLFLIDNYMRMLSQRANYIRDRCGEFLTSTKNKMLKARQRLADKLHLGITIGAQFSIPHTVPGSPRWLQQKFENAVAMCNAFGRPDLFITATCNVKWPEIKDRIPTGETWDDHPFLVNEVFKKKLDCLMELLNGKGVDRRTKKRKKGLFGRTIWFTYSIEFQQRGPPHAHILVSLKRKPKDVLQVDKLCQAVLPTDNPELRKLVEDFMVHTPCEGDPTAYCRAGLNPSKLQCSKGFPKCFNDTTKMGDRYYPELERPSNGEYCVKNRKADNRYIVPYNSQLLTFWQGHMNVEVVSVLSVIKYIFKYLFKGFDRALVEIATGSNSLDKDAMTIDGHLLLPKNVKIPEGTLRKRREEAKKLLRMRGIPLKDKDGRPTVVCNEFWSVEDLRAVTSCEAAWDIAGYPRHKASHTIVENSVHAEDEERLLYKPEEQEELGERLEEEGENLKTKLKAWFSLNEVDPAAHSYTFAELSMGYIYANGKWRQRKRKIKNLVSRIKSVNPRNKELYAIRLLCTNLKGVKSFKELRTVNNVEYRTAVEAAFALGFMNNEKEWNLCLAEACSYDNPKALRRLFCQIITNNPISKKYVNELYNKYKSFFYSNPAWEEKNSEAHTLHHLQSFLSVHGANLEDYGLPPLIAADLLPYGLVDDSGRRNFTEQLSKREGARLKKTMIMEQKEVFEKILEDIQSGKQTAFFLQGSGGTGKTRIMKAIYHEFRMQKKNVACVAQTGIAASLLPLGSTAHRQFKIPLSPEENMHSTIDHESTDAEYIKNLDLIIWDEATMADRRIFECVHKLLSTLRYGSDNKIFGGCPVILSGDWKQTLPVVPETPGEAVVSYTALEWPWWKKIEVIHLHKNMRARDDPGYAEYCAKIGTGELNVNPTARSVDQLAPLPLKMLVGSTKELITKLYGEAGSPDSKREAFRRSTILAVDNKTVFDLNDKLLGLLHSEERVFKSIDEFDPKHGLQHLDPETYHLATPSGYPRHELKIKVGAVVILLRNLNVNRGLTNGTRLVVDEIGAHIIRCCPLNPEKHMPKEVLLHPILFTPTGALSREICFTRMQYPIRLAFAMTCNKAQGQTLDRCGLVLTTPCFAHGQLYVALSRVRREEDILIYNAAKNPMLTNNVVFRKVLAYESAGDPVSTFVAEQDLSLPISLLSQTDDNVSNALSCDQPEGEELSDDIYDSEEEIVPRPRRNPAIRPVSTSTTPFGLQNRGNTCYGNSVVQTFWRMWKRQIEQYPSEEEQERDNGCFQALKMILRMPLPKDVAPLLQLEGMPVMYRDLTVQQSAAELFLHLVERIPTTHYLQLLHSCWRMVTCTVCKEKYEHGVVLQQSLLTVNGHEDDYREFNEYVHSVLAPQTVQRHCAKCGAANAPHPEELEVKNLGKYLVVEMSLFGNKDGRIFRRNRRIGIPNKRENIFGIWFKPIAAIWHRGRTPTEGHYTAYVEKDGRWIECDDSRVTQSEFPRHMEGIALMVFEREDTEEGEEVRELEEEPAQINNTFPTTTAGSGMKELILEKKSIIEVDTEVIVNAANAQLQHGGGVDGIIRAACGPALLNKAMDQIRRTLPNNQLSPGQVVFTDATNAGCIPSRSQEDHLRLCYFNSLLLAEQEGMKSLAFPLLGIGIYNYDEEKGMAVALQAVFAYFEAFPASRIQRVHLVAISSLVIGRLQQLANGKGVIYIDPATAKSAREWLEDRLVKDNTAKKICLLPGVPFRISSFL